MKVAVSMLASLAALALAHAAHAEGFRLALDGDAAEGPAGEPAFAQADTAAWSAVVGLADDFDGTEIVLVNAGVDWFVADHVSFGVFGEALSVSQDADDALGGGAGVRVRWHFAVEERFTLFAEAGCGLAAFDGDVPADGSSFNFTPRASFGATVDLGGGARLAAQVGWLHFSNAQTSFENPGIDALAASLGISWEF
ncbi:MAG: acyloxyacyl hydrolase [Planctomycetota bacterium]